MNKAEEILMKNYMKLPNACEEDWALGREHDMHKCILSSMEEYATLLQSKQEPDGKWWTTPCECKEEDQHGESWCCNNCGKMTSKHSPPAKVKDGFEEYLIKKIESCQSEKHSGWMIELDTLKNMLSEYLKHVPGEKKGENGTT